MGKTSIKKKGQNKQTEVKKWRREMILGVLGENRHHRDQKKTLNKKNPLIVLSEKIPISLPTKMMEKTKEKSMTIKRG